MNVLALHSFDVLKYEQQPQSKGETINAFLEAGIQIKKAFSKSGPGEREAGGGGGGGGTTTFAFDSRLVAYHATVACMFE